MSVGELANEMRRLWSDHTAYTQLVVVSAVNNLPSLDAYLSRLLRNQDDIGNLYGFYFGPQAASIISQLLKTHINIAVDTVKAAIAKNQQGINDALNRANQNNMDIANALSSVNPMFNANTIYQALDTHFKFITQAATLDIAKDFMNEVNILDMNHAHLMNFADYQTNVITTIFGAA